MAIAQRTVMWLDAIVTSADLQGLVAEMTPASVPLGNKGQLFFDAPEVSLVANRGLSVRCHAKLEWPVLGIDIGITIRSMTLLVVPSIEARDGVQVLVFTPEVDALDLALLPNIGDAELRAYLNRELQSQRIELPWNYTETLGHQFPLPEWFRSNAAFGIRPNGAAVKVTNDSMGLAIAFHAGLEPKLAPLGETAANGVPRNGVVHHHAEEFAPPISARDEGARDARESWIRPAPKKTSLQLTRQRKRVLAVGLAVVGGFGMGCLAGLWSSSRA